MNKEKEVLELKRYPESVLRKKALLVTKFTEKEAKLFEDMLITMYSFGGIGLAAPQVGVSLQIIVIDIGQGAIKLANPRVVESRGEDKLTEGCLSLPDINVEVKRPAEIVVQGLNEQGEHVEIKAGGLLARAIQHEIDHLKGRLIIDYLGLIDKMKLFKLKKRKLLNRT